MVYEARAMMREKCTEKKTDNIRRKRQTMKKRIVSGGNKKKGKAGFNPAEITRKKKTACSEGEQAGVQIDRVFGFSRGRKI